MNSPNSGRNLYEKSYPADVYYRKQKEQQRWKDEHVARLVEMERRVLNSRKDVREANDDFELRGAL